LYSYQREFSNFDHAMSLIQTKLYQPRTRSDLIPRAHLLGRLNAGLSGNVTLLCAPAGFGKTTLLAQWLQTSDRSTAWLSLDEEDNELRVFVRSLTATLQSVFPDAFQATASLFEALQYPPPSELASLFINDLADLPEDVVLVLDDYHLIHTSEVHTLLEVLIEHLPAQRHLVLSTRSDPPLPLARWRVRGYLNDLRSPDLRFTLKETEAFLTRALDTELAHETAGALEELTEGWIAVLRLTVLSLRSTSDRTAFLERLRNSPDHFVSSYLLEEILSKQSPFVQELLVRTSMLEPFCAGLCVAIMGGDTSHTQVQATLDWLESANLFLVPLDEHQGWYRFRHLFKGLLQQRLQAQSSQEELAMLHKRASAWYDKQGLVEEALDHAMTAGDAASAARLVEAQFLWAFEQEQLVQMERWLRLLPEEQIQGSPLLLFTRAWILQAHGQLAELPRLLTAAEQLLASTDLGARNRDNPQIRLQHALIAIGWSLFHYLTGQTQTSLESARSALEWTPPGEEYLANFAMMFLAWSYHLTGQEEVALNALNNALRDHSTQVNSTARLLFGSRWRESKRCWGRCCSWRTRLSPQPGCCLLKAMRRVWYRGKRCWTTSGSMSNPYTVHARRSKCWLCKRGPTNYRVMRSRHLMRWNGRLPLGGPVTSSARLQTCHRWLSCCSNCASAERYIRRLTSNWTATCKTSWQQ
jgi:LuxR family transcriptional regulator, maltose regulon positive regulatory protein